MDPVAVPYAVSKKLVDHARIRHDWGVMHVTLKGDDKEYYVDVKVIYVYCVFHLSLCVTIGILLTFSFLFQEFEMLYEDFGGFDGLYMKMLANGIPTAVHMTWIPFSELDLRQQFLLIIRFARQCFNGVWKSRIISYGRDWISEKVRNINDDIMMMIVFPMLEFVIPYRVLII